MSAEPHYGIFAMGVDPSNALEEAAAGELLDQGLTFDAQALDWPGVRETLVQAALWFFGLSFALYTLQWFAITAWLRPS